MFCIVNKISQLLEKDLDVNLFPPSPTLENLNLKVEFNFIILVWNRQISIPSNLIKVSSKPSRSDFTSRYIRGSNKHCMFFLKFSSRIFLHFFTSADQQKFHSYANSSFYEIMTLMPIFGRMTTIFIRQ